MRATILSSPCSYITVGTCSRYYSICNYSKILQALQLTPHPGPWHVVVLDNCTIHDHVEIWHIIVEECGVFSSVSLARLFLSHISGARLIYLPPYSPDFLEQSFHTIKAWLGRHELKLLIQMPMVDTSGLIFSHSRDGSAMDWDLWLRVCILGRYILLNDCATMSQTNMSKQSFTETHRQFDMRMTVMRVSICNVPYVDKIT